MQPYFAEVVEALTEVPQPAGMPDRSEVIHLENDLGMDSGLMLELIMQRKSNNNIVSDRIVEVRRETKGDQAGRLLVTYKRLALTGRRRDG